MTTPADTSNEWNDLTPEEQTEQVRLADLIMEEIVGEEKLQHVYDYLMRTEPFVPYDERHRQPGASPIKGGHYDALRVIAAAKQRRVGAVLCAVQEFGR